jgi:Cu/Ag efflux protein CusF
MEAGDAAIAVATVVAIDEQTRQITLKGSEGDEVTITAGPEVRNFDQIKRGDKVIMEYYQALAIALGPKGSGIRERVDMLDVERAKPGDKPAARMTKRIFALGTVESVDAKNNTVVLKGALKTVQMTVSEDVDLSKVKPGDEVEAVYTESFAVKVEPAPKVSGTVEMKTTSVAIGIGVEWGSGTLTMNDGSTHKFKINGLSVIDVGVSSVQFTGEVFHLVEAKDLTGTYVAGEAGATLFAGGSAMSMKNSKGVVMNLKSTQKGLKLTLAPEGLTIKMAE